MRRILILSAVAFASTFSVDVAVQAQTRTTTTRQATPQQATPQQATGQQAVGQQDGLGMIPDDARYLRDNRDPGQIVGGAGVGVGALRDQTGVPGQANQMTQGFQRTQTGFNTGAFNARGFNQFGGIGQMGQLGQMFGRNMNVRGARTREMLRTSVELGFQPPVAPTPAAVSSRVQNRIDRNQRIQEMGSVSIQMEGQTAVLQGQVASAQDRDLVARMLLLEPGISDVRNELTLTDASDPAAQP